MTTPLNQVAEEALTTFRHYRALADSNARKADSALTRFLDAISFDAGAAMTGNVPQCVKVWTNWLAENRPALRQTITEATGIKFTERGTPHTLRWEDVDGFADSDVPPSTIVRFRGLGGGKGRGQVVIYALWSQRYDVLPLFGVGPERPDPEPLTGVIRPPVSSHPIDPEFGEEAPFEFEGNPTNAEPVVQESPEDWAARVIAMREGETSNV